MAKLILKDGTVFEGQSFGYEGNVAGEVVFCTATTAYPETLTDASFAGQIVVLTYPIIGSYGVPEMSDKIQVRALLVTDYSKEYSHWSAKETLGSWLQREKIPALTGVDTRSLAKHIRENGVMSGRIEFDGEATAPDYDTTAFVPEVSVKEVVELKAEKPIGKKVILPDCGARRSIVNALLNRGVDIVRVPWNYDFSGIEADGLFLANGPGNPTLCGETVENIKKYMTTKKPILALCLGHQLLALAAGGTVTKLKYGHRSLGQSVRQCGTNRCFITSQNHGWAVDAQSLGKEWEPYFVNLNDGTNEGLKHTTNPWVSVQFEPEAMENAHDNEFIYDNFVKSL